MGLFDSASNVGQFGTNDSNIIRYKQAAEYAQDAKDYADLSGLIYETIKSPDIQEQLSNLNIAVEESAASAEAAKNSKMEAKEAAENAASDTTRIVNEQLEDQENRFTYFLNSSGYSFLGDYKNGPFLFSERNQYIRYDNQYYRLNAATDVGFTTTGTTASTFANDVTHFVLMDGDTLRQNLGSTGGADIVRTSSGITVQAALGALINKDRVIMLSNYYARGLRGENAFLAAYNDSFVNSYNSKIIVNDTKDWVPITRQYVFQSSVESAYHYWNYNANIAGVVGHYQMKGVAQFKFVKCYDPFVSIHILGDKTDAGAFPDNREASSFAVRFEEDVIGPTFIVNGRNYNGWLVGSLGRTVVVDGVTQKVGVQNINASSQVVAYNCGGSVCFAGTNGLGFINSIVEGNCTAGAFFLDCHDINIENFQPGKFKFQKCTSVVITKKLMGPSENYIYGCTGFHTVSALFITSQTDPAMSQQTKDVYSVEVVDSILHYSRVRGYGPNCVFKLGNYADVTIDNAEGVAINQFARLTSGVGSYTGLNGVSSVSVRLTVHNVAMTTGNTALGFSSKACFAIDNGIPATLTIKDGQIIWNTDYQSNPTYAVYGGNNSGSRITVDNVNFGGNYSGVPVYIPHQDAIGKLFTPGSEVNINGTLTTGNGRRLRIGWGISTTDAVWNTRCQKQVYFVVQLNDATNSSFIVTVDGHAAAYFGKMTGQVSGNFTVSKGQTVRYSIGSATLQDTYAELITG